MNSNKILKVLGGAVVAIILVYSFIPGDKMPYEETVLKHREELHEFMKLDDESPLPDSLKTEFTGLEYFNPDPAYMVKASVEIIPGKTSMQIPTSDGQIRDYLKYAYATFELFENQYRVTLLQPLDAANDGSLFLPFGDLTNGEATYGGGRYLDLELTTRNKITIDFNLSYNPYCVYNADYSCPLPPAENQLGVAISAGVKSF